MARAGWVGCDSLLLAGSLMGFPLFCLNTESKEKQETKIHEAVHFTGHPAAGSGNADNGAMLKQTLLGRNFAKPQSFVTPAKQAQLMAQQMSTAAVLTSPGKGSERPNLPAPPAVRTPPGPAADRSPIHPPQGTEQTKSSHVSSWIKATTSSSPPSPLLHDSAMHMSAAPSILHQSELDTSQPFHQLDQEQRAADVNGSGRSVSREPSVRSDPLKKEHVLSTDTFVFLEPPPPSGADGPTQQQAASSSTLFQPAALGLQPQPSGISQPPRQPQGQARSLIGSASRSLVAPAEASLAGDALLAVGSVPSAAFTSSPPYSGQGATAPPSGEPMLQPLAVRPRPDPAAATRAVEAAQTAMDALRAREAVDRRLQGEADRRSKEDDEWAKRFGIQPAADHFSPRPAAPVDDGFYRPSRHQIPFPTAVSLKLAARGDDGIRNYFFRAKLGDADTFTFVGTEPMLQALEERFSGKGKDPLDTASGDRVVVVVAEEGRVVVGAKTVLLDLLRMASLRSWVRRDVVMCRSVSYAWTEMAVVPFVLGVERGASPSQLATARIASAVA